MVELELVGLHTDGDHLVLLAPDGRRHRLPIDDALRAAVRRDRPRLEHLRATEESAVRPRDIQTRIRAGASEEEIAADAGLPLEAVVRYSGPVIDERAWIARQAQELPIGRETGAPTLGDLVVDRLAARGADADLEWDAVRRSGEPWEVVVRFSAGDTPREARWSVDLVARTLTALDDEGRWLSETELGQGGGRRHLSAVRARLYDIETDADVTAVAGRAPIDSLIRDARPASPEEPAPAPPAATEVGGPSGADTGVDDPPEADAPPPDPTRTEALLDELDASRGRRVPVESPAEDEPHPEPTLFDQEPEPAAARVVALPAPPPEGSGEAARVESEEQPARVRQRSKRTSVPSWDEIVFGAKPE